MDENVIYEWSWGQRTFLGKPISVGVFEFSSRLLRIVEEQQGRRYKVPPNCEALLVELQAMCNRGEIFLDFDANARSVPLEPAFWDFDASATVSLPILSPDQSSQQAGPSRVQSSPAHPSHAESSSRDQGQSSLTRKRASPRGKGPGVKRRRVEAATSPILPPAPTTSVARHPSPHTRSTSSQPGGDDVEHSSPIPVPHRPPVFKLRINLLSPVVDQNNGVRDRLRTEQERRRPTLYEEPLHPTFGINGTVSNALPAYLPEPHTQQPVMLSCTHCHCPLQWNVQHTTAQPAVCSLCGIYKEKKVSLCILYS